LAAQVDERRPARPRPARKTGGVLTACTLLLAASGFGAHAEDIALGRGADGHVTIEMRIGGEGPFTFALDTGATHTAVTRRLIRRAGLEPVHNSGVVMQTLTGPEPSQWHVLENADYGAGPIPALYAARLARAPDSRGALAGFLGLDALQGRRVIIDLSANRLRSGAGHACPDGAAAFNEAGLPVVEALVDGVATAALIDTGITGSVANRALAEALGARPRRTADRVESAGRRRIRVQEFQIRRAEIGGHVSGPVMLALAGLPVFEHINPSGPALIAGMDLLEGARIMIDAADRQACVKSAAAIGAAGREHP